MNEDGFYERADKLFCSPRTVVLSSPFVALISGIHIAFLDGSGFSFMDAVTYTFFHDGFAVTECRQNRC